MATKIGAGGRQQNYDPHTGRYTSTTFCRPPEIVKEEKKRLKERLRREELFNRAQNSRDPLVFETFRAIESALPGHVQAVNIKEREPDTKKLREFDIITKKCIIEVKSSNRFDGGKKQFSAQKRYAEEEAHKHHLVYAPHAPGLSVANFSKDGIRVLKTHTDLINAIKEYEK